MYFSAWSFNRDITIDNNGTGSSTSWWKNNKLQKLLNEGAYYNRTKTSYRNKSAYVTADFTSTGLMTDAKLMISEITWKLGGTSSDSITNEYYTSERGTEGVYDTEWTGKVGLMYPSDYGYATSGGSTMDRRACSNTIINSADWSDCKNNNWLYKSGLESMDVNTNC